MFLSSSVTGPLGHHAVNKYQWPGQAKQGPGFYPRCDESASRALSAGMNQSHEASHLLSQPSSTNMDDLRDRISRFKKDVKHRLGGSNCRGDKPGPGGREESVGSSTSFPQPEPRVSTGGDREQAGGGPSAENENVGASAAVDENRPDWRSTASSSAKLVLRAVRDSSDAFGPLKSVAGGLCFILENCEVRCLSS